ncbi:MAG: hypothetical protein KatS3mg115_0208 [Candidatus Poribacteria bacterium]|nr:MAG: hypothetical protein KatS3mg115_0208 [Candidatus Poribacteria bacterium]
MGTVRVAMIGAGSLAMAVHYPSLAEIPEVELVAVAELDPERLEAAADRYHIPGRYRDYRRMIEAVQPDAVYAIMPPHHLFDVAVFCLRAGCHLFIEKPPGVTAYQTESLAELAEAQRVKTMVGFNRRHIPLLKWAKDQVLRSGPLLQAVATFYKCHRAGRYYAGAVDILTCDAIHAVDSLRWLGGEVVRVQSLVKRYGTSFPNAFNALLEFESGATGVLLTNWSVGARVHTWEIHADGVSAFVDGNSEARLYREGSPEPIVRTTYEAAGSEATHRYYGFYDESRHFVDCLLEDRLPSSHLGDAVRTMRLVEAISHAAGRA